MVRAILVSPRDHWEAGKVDLITDHVPFTVNIDRDVLRNKNFDCCRPALNVYSCVSFTIRQGDLRFTCVRFYLQVCNPQRAKLEARYAGRYLDLERQGNLIAQMEGLIEQVF